MHPAIAALTPQQADALCSSGHFEEWLEQQGIPFDRALLGELFDRSLDPVVPPPDHPRRTDAGALRTLVEQAGRLPRRLREVANLCLVQGHSLQQCADRLGIARGTVRVHLRRLRAIQRMVATRPATEARACRMEG